MRNPNSVEAQRSSSLKLRLRVWQVLTACLTTLCIGMGYSFTVMFDVMERSNDRVEDLAMQCVPLAERERIYRTMNQLSQANDMCVTSFERNVKLFKEVLPSGFVERDGRFVLNLTATETKKKGKK